MRCGSIGSSCPATVMASNSTLRPTPRPTNATTKTTATIKVNGFNVDNDDNVDNVNTGTYTKDFLITTTTTTTTTRSRICR